jgi:hypothetical protein
MDRRGLKNRQSQEYWAEMKEFIKLTMTVRVINIPVTLSH